MPIVHYDLQFSNSQSAITILVNKTITINRSDCVCLFFFFNSFSVEKEENSVHLAKASAKKFKGVINTTQCINIGEGLWISAVMKY